MTDPLTIHDDNTPEARPIELGMTKQDFTSKSGQIIMHFTDACTPNGTERWRTNGACQVWKTRPSEFRQPIKNGLRNYSNITEATAHQFHRAEDCPHGHN